MEETIQYLERGKEFLNNGQLDEALNEFKKAIEIEPNLADAHNGLGVVYFNQGNLDAAITEYKEAIRIKPDYAKAHNNFGVVYFNQGNLDAATAEYKEAIRIKPDYADAHYSLGLVYFNQGKLDDATAEYKEAIRIKPDYANAHYNLGLVYFNQGKLDDATAEYKEAIRIEPDYAHYAHYGLGLVYSHQGKLDAAIAEYKEAIRINPDYVEGHYGLGNVYFDQGNLNDAITEYEEAIRINPDYADAHNNLGNVYYNQGKLDDAIDEYKEAIRINSDYAMAHYNLGNVYLNQGKLDDTIAEYKEAIRINPDYADAHNNLGNVHLNQGNLDAAITEYKEAIRINPELAVAHASIGVVFAQKGMFDDAISACRRAIEIDPNSEVAHRNLGVSYAMIGREQEAIESLKQAIRIKPDFVDAYNRLSGIYGKFGRFKEAIETSKQAISIKPDYAEAHMNLGMTYLSIRDSVSALQEYEILKNLNEDLAKELYGHIKEILKSEAMEKIVKSEDTLEQLANLVNFCMFDPDAGLELIETVISEEPKFESNLFLKFVKATAYRSKAFQTWQTRVSISHIDHLGLEELVKEIRLHITDEELNYLERALSEIRQIEDVDPEFLGKIGTEEDRIGENELEMIANILERDRPGRVQEILGKTKLSYFGVDRVKVLPTIEQLPPGELRPFTDIFFSLDSIVKSAVLVLLDRDARGRKYIMCMLYKKLFDELGPDETFEDAQLGGTIYLFDDGTFANTVEKESEPGKEEPEMSTQHSPRVNRIIEALQYGSDEDKLEAITLARGEANEILLQLSLDDERIKRLMKEVSTAEPLSDDEIETLRPVLVETASGGHLLVCWYATIAEVELGNLSDEFLEHLWGASTQLMSWLAEAGEASEFALTGGLLEFQVQKETIRALSRFTDTPAAGEMIKECFEGRALLGRQGGDLRKSALYAFGAIGNPDYHGLVEYWATRGEGEVQKAAKAALSLWGQASYDEIMKSAEEKKESKFCFIATSVYGTPYTPEVQTFKKFRDEFLLPKGLGRLFVSFYYRVSPVFASAIAKSKLAQRFTKLVILKPILWLIRGDKYVPDERNKER